MSGLRFGLLFGLCACVLGAGVVLAGAKQWIETGSGTVNGDIAGDYMLYGGEYYNGQGPPSVKDAKISISLGGKMAADMYRYMGPSAQLKADYNCGDFERREKGQLSCKRDSKTGAAYCHINFNLKTGKANLILGC
jgi:hypothetical protein